MGFATYRLIMLLPPGYRNSLGFNLPVFDSSYEIYVDGKLMGGNGTPGKTEAETKPGYERVFFRYNPVSDSVQIIINVSNFHHRRGGFWLPMKIGTFPEVQKKYAAGWARDWATISFLIGFSFLFFFFFIFYTRDSLMGFFSLATTGLAIRPLFTSNFLIHNIMEMTWDVDCKMGIHWSLHRSDRLVLVCSDTIPYKAFPENNMDYNSDIPGSCNTYTISSCTDIQLYDLHNLSSDDNSDSI